MLEAFEASGMSGQVLAIHHGIKAQTFASWAYLSVVREFLHFPACVTYWEP
jgi:hypothetical protein